MFQGQLTQNDTFSDYYMRYVKIKDGNLISNVSNPSPSAHRPPILTRRIDQIALQLPRISQRALHGHVSAHEKIKKGPSNGMVLKLAKDS